MGKDKLLDWGEVVLHAQHYGIMVSSWNDYQALVLRSHILKEVSTLSRRNKAVKFSMDDEGGQGYGSYLSEIGKLNIYRSKEFPGKAQVCHQLDCAGKSALND